VTKKRKLSWLTFVALGVGAIPAFVAALWVFMSVTSTPLHPKVQDITSVTRAEPAPRWSAAVEQSRIILRAALAEQNIPGLSIAVGVGDELVWAEGLGWADLENRIQVEPEMRFRLGTASKAVTSAAVGLLLEQDRLKLDEEIQQYVPEFPKKQWPVTLRQLLAHTAGLSTDAGDEGPFGDHCERPVEGLKFMAEDALRFEPDTQYRYSTFGWILVSAAIEAVTREPFARFMKTQVLEPLGMHDTRLDSKTEEIPNRATFYFPRFAADNRYGMQFAPDVDYSCYAGSIGFLSTPSDMVRFAIGMKRGTLLKPATVQLLQTSQRLRSGAETGYGLGWDLETATVLGKPTPTIGYDGESIGGTVGSFLIFPEHGVTVALLTNTSWVDSFSLAVKIAEAFKATNK